MMKLMDILTFYTYACQENKSNTTLSEFTVIYKKKQSIPENNPFAIKIIELIGTRRYVEIY